MMTGGETVKKLVFLLGLFLFALASSFSSAYYHQQGRSQQRYSSRCGC
jgi:hypothetical protein